MAFTFFKKKDSTPAANAQAKDDDIFGGTSGVARPSTASIEVMEGGSSAQDPMAEQAAIMFASEQTNDAIMVLNTAISDPNNQATEVWLMLLEIYQQQQNKTKYDEIALRFSIKFERTAPAWRAAANTPRSSSRTPAAQAIVINDGENTYFGFVGNLNTEKIQTQLQILQQMVLKNASVRIDFSQLVDLDAGATQALLRFMTSKHKAAFQWSGLSNIVNLLQNKIEVMRREESEIPYWVLLIEVIGLQGNQDAFENIAVDYAITYEVSPPSWDAKKYAIDPKQIPIAGEVFSPPSLEPAGEQAAEELDHTFILHGVINNENQLADLREYANHETKLTLDFHDVQRMDFICAGSLLNKIMAFMAQGKQISIVAPNELIIGLFKVMGITEMATIVRRKY